MGVEEPSADPSQRFIDNERVRSHILPHNTITTNDDDIDEGVGGDSDERINHLDRDNALDLDQEYEEVEPQHPPLANASLNDDKETEINKENDITNPTVPIDNRINNKNLEDNDSADCEYDNDEDSDENIINDRNIIGGKVPNNNDINQSSETRSGNWRNITSRNQSPQRFSQSQAYQQQHLTTNRPSRPFDNGSPFNRPRTVTVDRKADHVIGDDIGKEAEDEVHDIVDNGDLEGMADLVLSGHGDKLLSCRSRLPDVQMFIDNVPTYMAKIKAVHAYAREGNLRGVQTALDRRKFAVSRERGGLTPLHEAVLYGRAAVLRYLAARFPETLHARDHHGRTALHYAATLPDNAHFYNVLLTLGADKDSQDKYGKTPEHYLKSPGDLTHSQLLDEFEKGMHSEFGPYYTRPSHDNTDRDIITNAAVIEEGFPVFGAEDGQYLANSLGEPLIKGLTEVASVRPPQPVLYLANYLLDYNKSNNIDIDNDSHGWRSPDKEAVISRSRVTSAAKPRPISSKSRHFDDNFDSIDNNINRFDMNKGDSDDNDEITSVEVINDNNIIKSNDHFFMNGVSRERRNSQNQLSTSVEDHESAFKPIQRDDHGQSTLHFAASRTHGRNGLYQLLKDMDCNIALRDELYRTARDVAMQVNLPENVIAMDRFVVYLAANGFTDKLEELLLEGYDHILDATDEQQNIVEITAKRGHQTTLALLQTITTFEERRDRLHRAIRAGNSTQVQEMIRYGNGPQLAIAKNLHSRCSLHIAVLFQHESIVDHIATRYPQTLQIGDNLMRMPLHYAMGVDKVEILSRILIRAGAQRIVKDLKGRQPSYYFMNKSEIQQLQDEEDLLRQ